jgi:hypothetical protein
MTDSDTGLLARMPEGQDSWALASCPNDRFVSNADTLLRPVAESDGIVLRATPDSDSMPVLWFNYVDETLKVVNEWDSGLVGDVKTGLDATISFAHTYGHERHKFSAEFAEDAPEVVR